MCETTVHYLDGGGLNKISVRSLIGIGQCFKSSLVETLGHDNAESFRFASYNQLLCLSLLAAIVNASTRAN